MATLLQILAKELKAWPKEAKCIGQDANSRAYPYSGTIEYMGNMIEADAATLEKVSRKWHKKRMAEIAEYGCKY